MTDGSEMPIEEAPDAQLWQRWRQGERVDVSDFLAGFAGLESVELIAVLLVDQRERWQLGERIPAEAYLRRFPALEDDGEAVVELAYGEFLLREQRGERPALEEYQWRFPEHRTRLRQQVEFYRVLEGTGTISSTMQDMLAPGAGAASGMPVVPGYEVLEELGRGGMGVVYKARQVKANRLVALKMILAGGHAERTEMARFRNEAKAIAQLRHPNIVQVFEVGEHGGVPFFSLEFCPGGSLDRKLGGKVLPPREAATLVERLALAMQAAHEKRIVHRDLKPANVLLSEDGTPRISDFGLARKLDESGQTQTGAVMGTPSYMAPEQAQGKSQEVGPLADVYSLGAILYECLTGRPPFKAATYADTVFQVVEQAPVPPRRHNSATTRDLETICLKSLHKDRGKRYASAADLAEDLRRFLEDRPIKARRTPGHERVWRWCRRNPVIAGLLGVVAASLLLGTITSASFAVVASQRAEQAQQAQRQSDEKQLQAHLAEARARRFSGRVGQRFETLAAVARAVELAQRLNKRAGAFAEMRNLAIAALALPDHRSATEWEEWGQRRQLPPDRSFDYACAWAEQQEYFIVSDPHGNITVQRLADDAEVARLPGNGKRVEHRFLRDASPSLFLFDRADWSFKLWNFRSKELKRLAAAPTDQCKFGFTADGQLLWSLHKDGSLTVFEFPSGRQLRQVPLAKWLVPGTGPRGDGYLRIHPFRHQVAISLGLDGDPERRLVRILDLDRGTVVATLDRATGEETGHMAWHFDGETLAVGYSQSVVLWDVATAKTIQVIKAHKGGKLDVHSNRPGEVLLTYSRGGGGCKLWHPHTGKLLLSLPNQFIFSGVVASGDGRLWGLEVAGTRIQPWLIDPARECRTLVRHPLRVAAEEYRMTAIHKASRLAAVGTRTGVTLLDLATGADVGYLDLGHNDGVAFDPVTGDLLTYGQRGLFRWPVQTMAEQPPRLRLGPPRCLSVAPGGADQAVRITPDGKSIAVAQGNRVVVLHHGRMDQPVVLQPLENVCQHIAISPDGKWVATGRRDEPGAGDIRVWNAGDGKLVKTFGMSQGMRVGFSPDGQWLVANDRNHYHFWRSGTWEPGPQTPVKYGFGELVFSPDGRLLALERWDGAVRLVEVATGQELAVLEDPEQGRSSQATFSPDGTQLLLTNKDHAVLRLWDLRRLRVGLKRLDLDWAAPPYPPEQRAQTIAAMPQPLDVHIVGAERLPDPRKVSIGQPR